MYNVQMTAVYASDAEDTVVGLSHIVHPENNTGYQHEVPSDLQMTSLREPWFYLTFGVKSS